MDIAELTHSMLDQVTELGLSDMAQAFTELKPPVTAQP
jgi:hypothetical protein